MGTFPCDYSGHRYVGPQSSAYFGLVRASTRESKKLRLCSAHFGELLESTAWLDMDPDAETQLFIPNACTNCGGDLDANSRFAVFLTSYPARGERSDRFAELCHACVTSLALTYSLPVP